MFRGIIGFFFMLTAVFPSHAAEKTVKFAVPGAGDIRLQRIEASQVISDLFAGLFSDAVVLQTGAYRVHLIERTTSMPSLRYFDIRIGDDGKLSLAHYDLPISSSTLGNAQANLLKISPKILEEGAFAKLTFGDDIARGELSNISPVLRTTAWTKPATGALRVKVKIKTDPENAEIWHNEKRLDYRTSTEFYVPVSKSANAGESILVRRAGYANVLLKLRPDEDPASFDIKLSKTE